MMLSTMFGPGEAARSTGPVQPELPKPPPPDPRRGPRPYPVDDPGIGEPGNKPGSDPDVPDPPAEPPVKYRAKCHAM
jgi:hypothetical protein